MDDAARQKILDEAKQTLANKTKFAAPSLSADPLTRWREQAAQFEAEAEKGRQELRAEEERRLREAQNCSPESWDRWFQTQLRRHLRAHLAPSLEGVAQGVGALIIELRNKIEACDKLLDQQRDEIRDLRIECAKLAVRISEVATDKVLAAMPSASALRAVN
jgi:hypothetical protein